MFNSTIKEKSIIVQNTTASNDIWNACKVANISNSLKSPDGINTELGDRGVKLSGDNA